MIVVSTVAFAFPSLRSFCRQSAATEFISELAWSSRVYSRYLVTLEIARLDKTPSPAITTISSRIVNPSVTNLSDSPSLGGCASIGRECFSARLRSARTRFRSVIKIDSEIWYVR